MHTWRSIGLELVLQSSLLITPLIANNMAHLLIAQITHEAQTPSEPHYVAAFFILSWFLGRNQSLEKGSLIFSEGWKLRPQLQPYNEAPLYYPGTIYYTVKLYMYRHYASAKTFCFTCPKDKNDLHGSISKAAIGTPNRMDRLVTHSFISSMSLPLLHSLVYLSFLILLPSTLLNAL